jgi:hypothetical protein
VSKRRNGEASIFPYHNGHAAYAWVITLDRERKRKWVYGKTHDEVHEKWIKLQTRAKEGPMPTTTPTLASYLAYWLREVVEPNLAPKTTERYTLLTRPYLVPRRPGIALPGESCRQPAGSRCRTRRRRSGALSIRPRQESRGAALR